jgi:hypothetical protein
MLVIISKSIVSTIKAAIYGRNKRNFDNNITIVRENKLIREKCVNLVPSVSAIIKPSHATNNAKILLYNKAVINVKNKIKSMPIVLLKNL